MENLVEILNGKVIVSSRNVAAKFGKEHKNVLRDIESIKKDVLNIEPMFSETYAPDMYGRNQKIYLMNRDGFSLLAMGFTGKDALEWKVKYINAFNEIEEQASSNLPKMTQQEILIETLRLQSKITERVDTHDTEIKVISEKLDNQLTIDHAAQRKLQKEIAVRVYTRLDENSYDEKNDDFIRGIVYSKRKRQYFSALHREIKDRFAVSSYTDVKQKDFNSCLNYIRSWIEKK